jgi:hypothetical protein
MPKPISPIKRVNSLYTQCLGILEKEVTHLARLNIVEKLSTQPAKDLVAYIKLLAEMKKAQAAITAEATEKASVAKKALSDEELKQAVISGSPPNPFLEYVKTKD